MSSDRLLAAILAGARGARGLRSMWATVTSASPLMVRPDNAEAGVEIGPLALVRATVAADDHVLCIWVPESREWVVLGQDAAGGDMTLVFTSGGFYGFGGTTGLYYARRVGGTWDTSPTLLAASGSLASVQPNVDSGAAMSEPSTVYALPGGGAFEWGIPYGVSRIHRMADGKVLAFIFDVMLAADAGDGWSREAYRVRSGGTWGALTNLNESHATGEYWLAHCRHGESFYGVVHNNDSGYVQAMRADYASGALTTTWGAELSTGGNDEPMAAYYDGANGLFHVMFYDSSTTVVWLVAIDPATLTIAYSTSLLTGGRGILNNDANGVLLGDGGATFFAFSTNSARTLLYGWKVVAGASSYTVTTESLPAFPGGGSLDRWCGAALGGLPVIVGSLIPSSGTPSLRSLTRNPDGTYAGWDLGIESTTGFRFVNDNMVISGSGSATRVLFDQFRPAGASSLDETVIP